MAPLFRITHGQAGEVAEGGSDGLNYLFPYNTEWTGAGKVAVKVTPAQASATEGVVRFEVSSGKPGTVAEAVAKGKIGLDIKTQVPGDRKFDPVWGHSSKIRLRASSSDPSQTHTLVLANNQGQETLSVSFQAPKTPVDIEIPIPPEFRKIAADKTENSVAFRWNPGKSGGKIDLNLYGPITFEREAMKPGSPEYEFILEKGARAGMNTKLLAKALENLSKQENIDYALEIGKKGSPAILAELKKKLGIYQQAIFNGKVTPADFFWPAGTKKNPSILTGSLGDFTRGYAIPVEQGNFALEHGSYSHALQLLAMTKGMSAKERNAFRDEIYARFAKSGGEVWTIWDLLFDAPGDMAPNAPLWWRRQMEN